MVRVRFAPSPTGNLHIGTLRTALFSWLYAKQHKGLFVLRIEDTDLQRSDSGFEGNIFKGLEWFGITVDEGPNEGGSYGPYRQSERVPLGIYDRVAQKLLDEKKAYYCFCTESDLNQEREESIQKGIPYVYSRKALALTAEQIQENLKNNVPYSIRFKIPNQDKVVFTDLVKGEIQFDVSLIGDFVLVKSDGTPSYNFAVVVDDYMMKITHVIRGEDHISNTPKQILLYQALNEVAPYFAHLPMILGPDRTKLSKRHAATAITDYEAMGFLSEAFFNYLTLLGWSSKTDEEFFTKDELIERFSLDGISKSNAIFDIAKVTWMNGQYLRKLSKADLCKRVIPFLSDVNKDSFLALTPRQQEEAAYAVIDNLERLDQINDYIDVFLQSDSAYAEALATLSFSENDKRVLTSLKTHLETKKILSREAGDALLETILSETGFGKGQVFKPIRFALTARKSGPHIGDILVVLSQAVLLTRLDTLLR